MGATDKRHWSLRCQQAACRRVGCVVLLPAPVALSNATERALEQYCVGSLVRDIARATTASVAVFVDDCPTRAVEDRDGGGRSRTYMLKTVDRFVGRAGEVAKRHGGDLQMRS